MSKMRHMRRELRANLGKVVGYQIRDGYGASIAPVLERVLRLQPMSDAEFFDALADDDHAMEERERIAKHYAAPLIIPGGRGGKATALVSVRGTALYDFEFQPYAFSTQLLAQTVTALANDPEIGTVILDIDSPGGVVTGTPEAADAIFAARKNTNIVALVNPLAASAAYWLASQASEVVCVPSGDVGSVGVFMMHVDCSGAFDQAGIKPTFIFAKDSPYKVEGNMFEPLGDEAEAYLQGEVDTIMTQFVRGIARGRGVSVSQVLSDFGQGRTLMAPAARAAGMIDRVATIGVAMARWGVSAQTLEGRRRGEDPADAEPSASLIPAVDVVYGDARNVEGPADEPITYAKVGQCPPGLLVIIDEATGEEVDHVIEVNADEGWLVRHKSDDEGNAMVCNGDPACHGCADAEGDHVATERVEGQFRVERRVRNIETVSSMELARQIAPLSFDAARISAQPLLLWQETDDAGNRKLYAEEEWPDVLRVDLSLADAEYFSLEGDQLSIVLENGRAVYKSVGGPLDHDWIGVKADSSFDGPPPNNHPPAASADRAASVRRRLAIERHR